MSRGLSFDAPTMRGRGPVNPFELDARELVELFERRAPTAIDNWNDLGPEEYARAFTAAKTMGYDVVGDLYAGLLEVLDERGATDIDFQERVVPILRAKGWLPKLDDDQLANRVQLIYETNLRTAQAVGQWDRIQSVKVALPYLLGVTAGDSRVRHPPKDRKHDHRAHEGILLPVDHPHWANYFPPMGFRCRCSVVQLTRAQVARKGLHFTTEPELAERVRRLGPPWGFNPGALPLATVDASAEESNDARIEGAPPISTQMEKARARMAWTNATKATAAIAVEQLLANLFA